MTPSPRRPGLPRVVIVGGGFSGASTAVQLLRRSREQLVITIIDPAPQAGRGLAYHATDRDHRLNGPSYAHSLLPDDAWHFSRWCQAQNLLEHDPQALYPDGGIYARRADFGRYIEETLKANASSRATGSTIVHLRDGAIDLSAQGEALHVTTAGRHTLPADMVFVATGNPLPRLPRAFDPSLADNAAVIENPLDTARLHDIAPQARVLLVGSGLTALDVLSTLLRRQHRAEILVVSRRGLRPRPQGPIAPVLAHASGQAWPPPLPGGFVLDRIAGPAPAFLTRAGVPATVRGWLHALRAEIARVEAEGGLWYQAFDEMRDTVWQLWPALAAPEQRRFLRQLRTWYDMNRFRSPPQNQQIVDAAVAEGRIRFIAGRLQSVTADDQGHRIAVTCQHADMAQPEKSHFDVVINCTGLDALAAQSANPFLSSAMRRGRLRRDACSMGFEVDAQCRAVGADGAAQPAVRVVGPPTLGTFGDPIGAMFIGAQIHRMLPDALAHLTGAGSSTGST